MSDDEFPIVDDGLYDEDGLLKDDVDFRDKSKLINSVHKIFDIKYAHNIYKLIGVTTQCNIYLKLYHIDR